MTMPEPHLSENSGLMATILEEKKRGALYDPGNRLILLARTGTSNAKLEHRIRLYSVIESMANGNLASSAATAERIARLVAVSYKFFARCARDVLCHGHCQHYGDNLPFSSHHKRTMAIMVARWLQAPNDYIDQITYAPVGSLPQNPWPANFRVWEVEYKEKIGESGKRIFLECRVILDPEFPISPPNFPKY